MIEIFRKHIELEIEVAEKISKSVEKLKNVVVREIFKGMAHDSRKHAGFFTAIVEILKGERQAIFDEDFIHLAQIIKEHIDIERKMSKELGDLLKYDLDKSVKHLLKEIQMDEEKHHKVMERILDLVINKETISDKQYWDMIWKDVPGHSALVLEGS
jgi:bacterioferritin (cytochrome b1)